jgi:hypothetical protein
MGEAKRRKLIGDSPTQGQLLSRSQAISFAWDFLSTTEDATVSGVTVFPSDGSEPVYIAAEAAKRPPGRRH